jgi:hypothetical protein
MPTPPPFLDTNVILRHLLNDVPAIGTSTISPVSLGWNRNAPERGFPRRSGASVRSECLTFASESLTGLAQNTH